MTHGSDVLPWLSLDQLSACSDLVCDYFSLMLPCLSYIFERSSVMWEDVIHVAETILGASHLQSKCPSEMNE